MPALPLGEAGFYVAAAFAVVAVLVLVYVAIIGGKIARIERDLGALTDSLEAGARGGVPPAPSRQGP